MGETISLSKQTQTEASRNVENCFPAQEKPESRVKNTDVCSSPVSPVSKLVSISRSQLPPGSAESTPARTSYLVVGTSSLLLLVCS